MTIEKVATFHSPLTEKFGIPRQAGLVGELEGKIVLEPAFRSPDALRGLEGFDYIWLIWGFNLNRQDSSTTRLTVRPPRLGGNTRMGVFATRSPFRPNPIGLSSVRISNIDFAKGEITVKGADLADGTPIYDIKPYVTYTDSHPGASSGFVDEKQWERLSVEIPMQTAMQFGPEELAALKEILSEDPRPQYSNDPERIYGMAFAGHQIHFKVDGGKLTVIQD